MFFDSHAHLDEDCFQPDFDEILANMRENGVTNLMNIGFDLASSERSIRLSEQYDWIYAAIGSHPDDAAQVDGARIEAYRKLAQNPQVKAIGEIGLDYHYEDPVREVQKEALRMQLSLARELDLPVVIHEREAHGDAMEILKDFPTVCGVFHCFSGSVELARELVKRGWYIGLTGVVTFKNARKAVEVAQSVPLERLVIETDCPYMAPVPYRGKRNDPSYVPLVAQKIAALRGLTAEEVGTATAENAKRLFRIA